MDEHSKKTDAYLSKLDGLGLDTEELRRVMQEFESAYRAKLEMEIAARVEATNDGAYRLEKAFEGMKE